MNLSISESGVEPITLDEAKQQCYIATSNTDTDVEALLNSLITAARKYAENRMWRQLVDATITYKLDRFPEGDILEVPRPPLVSVTSIQYEDINETTQTISSDDYNVDSDSEPGRIEIIDSWPLSDDQVNAVAVTYEAGYGDDTGSSTVPEDIKIAIKMLVKFLYDNRDTYVLPAGASSEFVAAPIGTNYLLDQYSVKKP